MDDSAQTVVAVVLGLLLLLAVVLLAPELISQPEVAPPPSDGVYPPPSSVTQIVTVMVVIPEVCITRRVPDPAAETAIIRELILRNFRVVDQNQVKKIRYNDQTLLASQGDEEALKALQALALEYDADLLVIGEAFGEQAGATAGGYQSVRARVEIRGIMTRTARIVVSEAETQGGADLTFSVACKTALQNAGQVIGQTLVRQLEARFGLQPAQGEKVELIVTSISFNQYLMIKQKLSSLPAIKEIIADHYTDQQAQLTVNYAGDLTNLVEQAITMDLNGYHLEVLTFSNTRVSFKLVKS